MVFYHQIIEINIKSDDINTKKKKKVKKINKEIKKKINLKI